MNRQDQFIIGLDRALRALFVETPGLRPPPFEQEPEADLRPETRRRVAALMRVNHAGEVCAQALYQGQALTARDPGNRAELEKAAQEEMEHLAWTGQRIRELGGRKSFLNPFWYAGALGIGMLAGKCGEKWNLGFLAETERQVAAHLQGHLEQIPEEDARSRAIVRQMQADETRHAETALRLGGVALPKAARGLMRFCAKVMTKTACRI
ncbi:MAG: 2-polyprenyl-3-methyl-6-methoxy-1,4-benzoquinone monooxygenase [Zoogloeaceae bacterium]|nr:2-polyprenyl-3-methyl-6-methoxy-1,4-benzoquinone monooxygenase [Zoogloeaceae bacterium]